MHWTRWVICALAAIEAAWMIFDGSRALLVGSYVTATSGEYAGQLGPWAKIVSLVGIDPQSNLMKWIFVVYGIVWLIVIGCFILRLPWTWWAMLIAAAGALWYFPVGTLINILQILLLVYMKKVALN